MSTALNHDLRLRPLTAADNAAIAGVIREVSAEFGLTADRGYTVADPDLDRLFELYSQPDSAYWVVELEGKVVGGGGVAPLQCSSEAICELQKMYFLPVARGLGLARTLALNAMDFARKRGYQRCYLETTASLTRAIKLYQQLGFTHIDTAMGCTGHVDCEVRMLKTL
ncbi:GNAT family N-acetyltransferase [Erwinia sp. OLTSP20]|uniref:GNAT family N-acetyltransferase n=1 Tax=unclassified Erwinia TaxID=2622719 RepID=UPI000C191B78|nr:MULTISPECIES: GNAT family N-acetyltransferase [unclassified Erwinia]PIJ51000.1 GNAT family N-acetyltransferase [Erwinia sp. OAMSP11]PIJ73732.1 GNAT family N-acetyltransferase [Erwinia sp. OLSSP12]PIJ83089.1 GNAT family N-acetyltransferase [Erwinia sp. OLCASP19]PIJ85687.1 GNAT family N-acetyltransferase [Erwinia sp. OLMTSP26]PIJ87662.1 GNAT family N-acetyltransferase [Erwinia sp. OLMDSP33]